MCAGVCPICWTIIGAIMATISAVFPAFWACVSALRSCRVKTRNNLTMKSRSRNKETRNG
jgi:hypothetical protein